MGSGVGGSGRGGGGASTERQRLRQEAAGASVGQLRNTLRLAELNVRNYEALRRVSPRNEQVQDTLQRARTARNVLRNELARRGRL